MNEAAKTAAKPPGRSLVSNASPTSSNSGDSEHTNDQSAEIASRLDVVRFLLKLEIT
jgi:hypothetical protein